MSLLDQIFEHKREEVSQQKAVLPLAELRREAEAQAPGPDFLAAMHNRSGQPALIAEIKRRSPTRGLLSHDFDPARLAQIYLENGASAISVLTDEHYFGGSLDHLRCLAAQEGHLPLLRKDFVCDPYQIYQARLAGASAVLLIVASLDPGLLAELHELALRLELTPLVEVHTLEELNSAMRIQPRLIGVNNRDLHDFTVRLDTTLQLKPHLPPGIRVVSESGIHTREDAQCLGASGVDAILVGEAIVTAAEPGRMVRELAGRGAPL
jgi:indole-3-glycerol phosphate synthase